MELSSTYVVVTMKECAHTFAMLKVENDWLRESHESFNCPHCSNTNYYPQTTDKERLENNVKRLERERNRAREQAEHEMRSKIAIKGHHTRLKKRIAGGVCPCCNRTFVNMTAHMTKQHPTYLENDHG